MVEPPTLSRRQRTVIAAGPIVAFLGLALIILYAVYAVRAADERVEHTDRVVSTADRLLVRLVDAETGQRGFIITGDSAYLAPYRGAEADVEAALAQLDSLTRDNAPQQARLDTLRAVVVGRLSVLDQRILIRRGQGFESARQALVTGGGKELMGRARGLLRDLMAEERRLLAERAAREKRAIAVLTLLTGLGLASAGAITMLLHGVLARYAAAQERARQEVEGQNLALQEQAAELEMQQAELEAQAAQLEEQAAELQLANTVLAERTELAERARAEAQDANMAKMQFLTAMSHELRTPLNAIMGYTELLALGIHGAVTEQQATSLERVRVSAVYLLSLINDVLNFARVQAGKIAIELGPVKVDDSLQAVDTLMRPQADARGLTLEPPPTCPGLEVVADPDRLQQILLNLLGNAIKYTEPGGTLSLECRQGDGGVFLGVRDTGRGIPADRLETIFEPFVQVERDPARGSQHGVGLGLSISRELARAMGGDITVVSDTGSGSVFTLWLPQPGSDGDRRTGHDRRVAPRRAADEQVPA